MPSGQHGGVHFGEIQSRAGHMAGDILVKFLPEPAHGRAHFDKICSQSGHMTVHILVKFGPDRRTWRDTFW